MSLTRVAVRPELLRWAVARAGLAPRDLARRFPKFDLWERGEQHPTFKQIEEFAKATHAPIGFFFLAAPPVEAVPIPDFRTIADERLRRPSPDLLDTIYLCQQRQHWYREFCRSMGETPCPFVGSLRVTTDVITAATNIRDALSFDLDERRAMPSWTDALRRFIDQADALGVMVMCSGVVHNNNRRRLDPEEFRGFAMSDELAPLVFINGADTKAAQMFTLAHELAHIWLGESAVTDAQALAAPNHAIEQWCNRVAAELLVPLEVLRAEYRQAAPLRSEMKRLAARFKVSTLVTLRRIHDAGGLSREAYWDAYNAEVARLRALPRGDGGDFYLTLGARASKRFARALVVSTLEGRTLYTEAFRLLGLKKMATFHDLSSRLGVGD